MTGKWPSLTPNPPRIPVFYTLSKIHKPTPVGRTIISGCDGPTEFINFVEKTKLPQNVILASMDVTSLYSNIPQEEGITTVCQAYEAFYIEPLSPPPPHTYEVFKRNAQSNLTRKLVPLSALTGAIIYKPMELPWERKWP